MKKMSQSLWCMLFLAALHVAASAPNETSSKPATTGGKKSSVAAAAQPNLLDQMMNFFQPKPEKGKRNMTAEEAQKKLIAGGQNANATGVKKKGEQENKAASGQPQGGAGVQLTTAAVKPMIISATSRVNVVQPPFKAPQVIRTYPPIIPVPVRVVPVNPPSRVFTPVKISPTGKNIQNMNGQIKVLKGEESSEKKRVEGQEPESQTSLDQKEEDLNETEPAQKKSEA